MSYKPNPALTPLSYCQISHCILLHLHGKQVKVHPILNLQNHFVVESSTNKGFYLVNGECNCQDAQDRAERHCGYCKHRRAAVIYQAQPQAEDSEPMRKPWSSIGAPRNAVSNRPYSGINILLLGMAPYADNRWLTYKQAAELSSFVRKGEKATLVVFWRQTEVREEGLTKFLTNGKGVVKLP
jgi:hypothetical protein